MASMASGPWSKLGEIDGNCSWFILGNGHQCIHRDSHGGMYHHTSAAIPRVASRLRLHPNENIKTNRAEEV